MTEVDLHAYLRSKGLRVRLAAGGREVTCPCFFPECNEPADSDKRKLYVNRDSGVFFCFRCNARGHINSLRQMLGDEPIALQSEDPYARHLILDQAVTAAEEMLFANEPVLRYLMDERGLTPETIMERRIGFVPESWSLIDCLPQQFTKDQILTSGLVHKSGPQEGKDYFTNKILIPFFARGHILQIRARRWGNAGPKYLSGPGEVVRAYNMDSLDNAEDVLICEAELDAIAVAQALAAMERLPRRMGVIGLSGANTWPEDLDDRLSEAKRIFFAFDADTAGRKAAEKLQAKVGKRARIIEPPEEGCDWSDWLLPVPYETNSEIWKASHPHAGHTGKDLLRLISRASGRRIFSIAEFGQRYRDYKASNPGLKTGYATLDELIAPGIMPGQVMFILAGTGTGKGHPLDTEIVTPDGLRMWGDLQVGDRVFGSDGKPTKVTGVYERGVLPTYRAEFTDHTSVDVDADHLWTVQVKYGKHGVWTDRVMSTKELMSVDLRKAQKDGRRPFHYRIPLAAPVFFPERDLPIDPYALGALLSNGHLHGTGTELITPDPEVVARVRRTLKLTVHKIPDGACPTYGVLGIRKITRELGVDKHSYHKFIPEMYLTASIGQRVALLQGLMDGDGGNRGASRRSVNYFTSSRALADDIVRLVNSLGGTGVQKWTDRKRGHAPECRVSINPPPGLDLFYSSRKKVAWRGSKVIPPHRGIASIVEVEPRQIRCISVEAEDSLYQVTRNHIVTHNSVICCNLAVQMRRNRILFITLEMTGEETYMRLERIYLFHNPRARREEIEFALENIWICDENMLAEKDVETLIGEYELETGAKPDVVIIDYLGYFAEGMPGSGTVERNSKAALLCKRIAKQYRCAVISPQQVTGVPAGKPVETENARDSKVIGNTGDFVIGAWNPDDVSSENVIIQTRPSGRLVLKLLKSRHGNKGKIFNLRMDLLTLALVAEGTPEAKEADRHNFLSWRGHTYDQLRAEETKQIQEELRVT